MTFDVVDLVDQHHIAFIEAPDESSALGQARVAFAGEGDMVGVYRYYTPRARAYVYARGDLIGTV